MEENNSQLIVFEGPNGAGKTTIMRMFTDYLKQNNYIDDPRNILITKEPGTPHLKSTRDIRRILIDFEDEVSEVSELLLFFADRYEHINRVIRPALKEGKIVISDRFWYSTYVYQRMVREVLNNYPEIYTSLMEIIDVPTVDYLFIILSNKPHDSSSIDRIHDSIYEKRDKVVEYYYNIHQLCSLSPDHKEEFNVKKTVCIDNNAELPRHKLKKQLEDTFKYIAEKEMNLSKKMKNL